MSSVTEAIVDYGIENGMERGVGRSAARLAEGGTLSVEPIAAILDISPNEANEVGRHAREHAAQ